jgi:hypothetical protein
MKFVRIFRLSARKKQQRSLRNFTVTIFTENNFNNFAVGQKLLCGSLGSSKVYLPQRKLAKQ